MATARVNNETEDRHFLLPSRLLFEKAAAEQGMDVQLTDRFSTCQTVKTLSICDGTTVNYANTSNVTSIALSLSLGSDEAPFPLNVSLVVLLFFGLSHRRLPINLRLNFHWM